MIHGVVKSGVLCHKSSNSNTNCRTDSGNTTKGIQFTKFSSSSAILFCDLSVLFFSLSLSLKHYRHFEKLKRNETCLQGSIAHSPPGTSAGLKSTITLCVWRRAIHVIAQRYWWRSIRIAPHEREWMSKKRQIISVYLLPNWIPIKPLKVYYKVAISLIEWRPARRSP